jgi:hypothetical protein
MRAFRSFVKHLLSTQPNTPPPKKDNWFSFDWLNPGRAQTATTRVEPTVPPGSSSSSSSNSSNSCSNGNSSNNAAT